MASESGIVVFIGAIFILSGLKVLNEYERGVSLPTRPSHSLSAGRA